MDSNEENLNRHQISYAFIRPTGNDALLLHSEEINRSNASGSGKGNLGLMSAFSGGIAGGTQILMTYPAEYIKTQLQLDEQGKRKLYNGSFDCIKKTYKNYGVLQFYRGLPVLLYSCIPKTGIRFYILENFRISFGDGSGQLSTQMKLLSGLAAGACEAVVVVTPFESIKVKFINDERNLNPQFKSFVHGVQTILKTKGVRGIFQGNTATILKQGLNQAVRFSAGETFKDIYTGGDRKQMISMLVTGIFGALTGAISVYVNNPIDVIKTRMQGLEAQRYKNTLDCAMQIFKNEGWKAFYKGVVPHMLRTSADVAITFMVYETFIKLFSRFFES